MIGRIVKTSEFVNLIPKSLSRHFAAIGWDEPDRFIRPTEESVLGSRFGEGSAKCPPHEESARVICAACRGEETVCASAIRVPVVSQHFPIQQFSITWRHHHPWRLPFHYNGRQPGSALHRPISISPQHRSICTANHFVRLVSGIKRHGSSFVHRR